MEICEFSNISFEHPMGDTFKKYRSKDLAPVQFTNPNFNHRDKGYISISNVYFDDFSKMSSQNMTSHCARFLPFSTSEFLEGGNVGHGCMSQSVSKPRQNQVRGG